MGDDAGGNDGGANDGGGGDGQIVPFSLTSNDLMPTGGPPPPMGGLCFKNGQTHNTGDMSPALSWAGAPAGTMSFALSLNDTNNGLTHWVMYDIPANVTSLLANLPQGAMPAPPAPAGSKQKGASFDTNNDGFFGPGADYHTYEFKLWAISSANLPVSGEDTSAMYSTLLPANSVGSATLLVCGDINAVCNATCP
jgi:Raf kinase inhibitor-like YbhB/YbcL family protein